MIGLLRAVAVRSVPWLLVFSALPAASAARLGPKLDPTPAREAFRDLVQSGCVTSEEFRDAYYQIRKACKDGRHDQAEQLLRRCPVLLNRVPANASGEQLIVQAVKDLDVPLLRLLLARKADVNVGFAPLEKLEAEMARCRGKIEGLRGDYRKCSAPGASEKDRRRLPDIKESAERYRGRGRAAQTMHGLLVRYGCLSAPDLRARLRAKDDREVMQIVALNRVLTDNASLARQVYGPSRLLLLHYAVLADMPGVAKALLSHGTPADAPTAEGFTPLYLAVAGGAEAVAPLLLEAGADASYRDTAGNSLLHFAVRNRNPTMVELLLQHKAEPSGANQAGQTALHLAVQEKWYGHEGRGNAGPRIVRALLAAGCDPDAQDRNGDTPLHYAVGNQDAKAVEVLMSAKADIQIANKAGVTPLNVAIRARDRVLARVLTAAESTDIRPVAGRTSTDLHKAAAKGDAIVVRRLLDGGADPNVQDARGDTPLHLIVNAWFDFVARGRMTPMPGSPLAGGMPRGPAGVPGFGGQGATAKLPSHVAGKRKEYLEIARVLLEHKADPNVKDDRGHPAWHLAYAGARMGSGNGDMMEIFQQFGVTAPIPSGRPR